MCNAPENSKTESGGLNFVADGVLNIRHVVVPKRAKQRAVPSSV